ncbi:lysylphosphatidylglycerol synthase transmembrane domain-containing protein [Wenyingzhuangia sp. 2_MG-2023]|uniref:lysylphosphatidylglycerol synthase transmembrane domain-containing protein n=1 Tax=Wenyingzhuangia sp. 2_MG-2023 TaxID=3062639 RepID=UPI0026E2904E|nr:lysylphosphatidylglycerol synthase transmembrane domain-containing protein [Wenyingzhuangia sp. 2_MG-2023]MDO6736812.1 lysylphosphatidylglycerol synthase transmembrane domain-containing protein [Wenyingzhuangia sp. 2_MG-2023]
MKGNIQKKLKTILPVGLGIFLIWHSLSKFTEAEISEIKFALTNANYWWIVLSVFLGILSHASRAYRWKFTLDPMGYQPKFYNQFFAVAISYLVNLGIPRAGEFARATTINQYENIPFEKAFGTIVAERLADMAVYLLIIFLAFLAQYDIIYNLILSKIPPNPLLIGGIVLCFSVLCFVFLKAIKNSKNVFFVKLRSFSIGLKEGLLTIYTMKKKWAFIAHTLFIWLAYVLMLYVVIFAFPETKDLGFNAILICFVAGTFSYATTNGGIGSYPYIMQKTLLLYAIPETIGAGFGWIMWSAQTLLVILLGGLSFILLPIFNKSR